MPPASGSWIALGVRLALRGVLSPWLGVDLLRMGWAFRRRNWWRLPPFVPLPDQTYLRWRMDTAYGDPAAIPPLADVVSFARWRREVMRL
ncbi:MAG: hypothetical protein SGI84_06855 [Gemmatimonadota bacterium]|nr:hypothetical protein [Gemmatimonadota bacterium]